MQPRRLARELALLSVGQLPKRSLREGETPDFQDLIVAAVRTLTAEAHDALETGANELKQSDQQLLNSELQAGGGNEPQSQALKNARSLVRAAIESTQGALNRIATALELPEFIQVANQEEVRGYAIQLTQQVCRQRSQLDQQLDAVMTDWQVTRLPRIDQDILRLAAAEILYLGIPHQVAINEAVELAKRYSDADGHRFINGVLRRFVEALSIEA
ncbi:MAG: transcription antitermination factor NusB [Cyanobacteria bacterium P01_H01_bin.121]